MSWILKSAENVSFSFNLIATLNLQPDDYRFNASVEKIMRMPVSDEEKLRQLKEQESAILQSVAEDKAKALINYANESLHIQVEVRGHDSAPKGTVNWSEIIGITTNKPVEETPSAAKETEAV